jgi:uncharacterized protein (TIGR02271 family)
MMNAVQYRRATGLFYSRDEAEAAIRDLKNHGFNMDRVSVIAKDGNNIAGTESTENIGNKADEGAATGALTGGALGGITGLLVGLGALAIPGIGPILLAGATATTLATTLAGAGIGAAAGGLVGALVGLGIPEERAKLYSDRVATGSFLVMVEGRQDEMNSVVDIMRRHGVEELDVYDLDAPTNVAAVDNRNPMIDTHRPNTGVVNTNPIVDTPVPNTPVPNTPNVSVDRNPSSINTMDRTNTVSNLDRNDVDVSEQENIKLYEERLVVDKEREKTGEVSIGKRVETEMANISVPVEKERVVIERTSLNDSRPIDPNTIEFGETEVARIDVYEESATIDKEAFVREEVTIRKEVEQNIVSGQESLRREELEIESEGKPDIDRH